MTLKKLLIIPALVSLAACNATMEKISGDFFGNPTDPVLLSSITYVDAQMQACVDAAAATNGWTATTQVTGLACDGYVIADLADISNFINLDSFRAPGSTFADVTPLSTLTKLTDVFFDSPSVTDISSFASLTNLTSLNIPGTGIGDISVVSSLPNLQQVFLHGTTISDPSPLFTLSNLNGVGLPNGSTNADVVSIDAANPNISLFAVNASPLITDLTPLADNNLSLVHIFNLGISDLNFLSNSSSLTSLMVHSIDIDDLSVLADKTQLNDLNFFDAPNLDDISPIGSDKTGLTSASFTGNISLVPCSQYTTLSTDYPSATITQPTSCALYLAADILGTWVIPGSGTPDSTGFVTFLDDTHYFHVEDGVAADGPDGVEFGTYTLDTVSGVIVGTPLAVNGGSTIIDTNGTMGLSDSQLITTTVTSITDTQLTVGDINGSNTLDKLVDDPTSIVGTYFLGNVIDQREFVAIAFLADGTYIFGQYGLDTGSAESAEWGTYSYDAAAGDLTFTTVFTQDPTIGLASFGGFIAGTSLSDQRIYTVDSEPGATDPIYLARASLIPGVDYSATDVVGNTYSATVESVTLPGANVISETFEIVFTDAQYAEQVGAAWQWSWGIDENGKLRIGEVDTDGSVYNFVVTLQESGESLIELWSHPFATADERIKHVAVLSQTANNGAMIPVRNTTFTATNVDDGVTVNPSLSLTKGTGYTADSVKNTIQDFSVGGAQVAELTFYSDHGLIFDPVTLSTDPFSWWVSDKGELVIVASVGGGDMERYTLTNLNDGTALMEGTSPPAQVNVYSENLKGTLTFISDITF